MILRLLVACGRALDAVGRLLFRQYFQASLRDVYKIMLGPAAVVWAAALLALVVFRVIL